MELRSLIFGKIAIRTYDPQLRAIKININDARVLLLLFKLHKVNILQLLAILDFLWYFENENRVFFS